MRFHRFLLPFYGWNARMNRTVIHKCTVLSTGCGLWKSPEAEIMNYTPEQKANWDEVMRRIEASVDKISFDQWLRPLELYAVTSDALIIIGQSNYQLMHMRNRFANSLYSMVRLIFNRVYELEFHTRDEIAELESRLSTTTLNERYTFDNFITGPSNRFAYSAAFAVAEEPGSAYNPLFIYGGVGLGKTHLMNAIGNDIRRRSPSTNVVLMSSEALTNQVIDAISKRNTQELRARLRSVDVLMVDDIQFLSKTKSTQEEFFHTFNDLYGAQHQIVISSDRPPKEIPEIEERLRSRFEWGLIVDIQKPDFETRMAILKRKAADEGLDIPYETLEYIASNVNSNIRELEGCLTSLNAYAAFRNMPITLEMAQSVLADRIRSHAPRRITPDLIIEVIAAQYGITANDITGSRRSRNIAMPRQLAMYLCREMTGLSTTGIGRAFGNRDHTTIMHGCDRIADAMNADFAFRKRVEELMELVRGQ